MAWVTPERLFVCLNKHTPAHAQRLSNVYDKGGSPTPEAAAIRDAHLRYRYDLGQRGLTWAAGALSGFIYALAIYSVNSLEEAQKAQENDPYSLNGMGEPERYFEWFIHMPISRAAPAHKARLERGLKEAGIDPSKTRISQEFTTPKRLFVCLSKHSPEHAQRLTNTYAKGMTLSPEAEALRHEHLRYVYELGEKGITWAGGPSADGSTSLSIYAVNSLEEAKKARQNDPYYRTGNLFGDEYYEWTIHMPIDRASPGHKERLKKDLMRMGVLKG